MLTKKMSKGNYEKKYNKIKETFLEKIKIDQYIFSNKLMNIPFFNNKNKKITNEQTSLPQIPSFNTTKKITHRTDKNLFKYFGFQGPKLEEKNKDIIGIKKYNDNNYNTINTKKLLNKKNKFNKYFVQTSSLRNDIKKNKIKILYDLWNKCNINIIYDCYGKIKNKNEIIINDNNINIINKENNNKKINIKHFSKKCNKALNYDELTHNGIMNENKKAIKTSMINQIIKLTSRNTFDLKFFHSFDNNNKINNNYYSNVNKKYNESKVLTKSLSYKKNNL